MGRSRPQSGTPLIGQQDQLALSAAGVELGAGAQSFSNPLGLPKLSTKQLAYILLMQGVGAALLGDIAVTVFIQGILTFLISSSLIHADMRKGTIKPFATAWPAPSYSPQLHRLERVRRVFSGSCSNSLFDFSVGLKAWFGRLGWSIWQGAVISACYFCLIWPIAIAILAPRYGGAYITHSSWIAPVTKAVYGAVLGLLQTPLIACIALGAEDAVRAGRLRLETDKAGRSDEAEVGSATSSLVEPSIAPLSPAHVV